MNTAVQGFVWVKCVLSYKLFLRHSRVCSSGFRFIWFITQIFSKVILRWMYYYFWFWASPSVTMSLFCEFIVRCALSWNIYILEFKGNGYAQLSYCVLFIWSQCAALYGMITCVISIIRFNLNSLTWKFYWRYKWFSSPYKMKSL